MASLPTSRKVTYEEWLQMPILEDAIEEVVNGDIRIMPANKWNHTRIVHQIAYTFQSQIDPQRVLVISQVFGLIIRKAPLTTRVPDLAVFEANTIVERDGYIHSAPQRIVEVRSPRNTSRERTEKLQDYASLGVPEVWDVVPDTRTVEVLLLEAGQFHRAAILSEGLLKPTCFPGVQIDITQIWPD